MKVRLDFVTNSSSSAFTLCSTVSFKTDDAKLVKKVFGKEGIEEKDGVFTVQVLSKEAYGEDFSETSRAKKVEPHSIYELYTKVKNTKITKSLAYNAKDIEAFCKWINTNLKVEVTPEQFTYDYELINDGFGEGVDFNSDSFLEVVNYFANNLLGAGMKKYILDEVELDGTLQYTIHNNVKSYIECYGIVDLVEGAFDETVFSKDIAGIYDIFKSKFPDADIDKLKQQHMIPIFIGSKKIDIKSIESNEVWFVLTYGEDEYCSKIINIPYSEVLDYINSL